jgi:hypothetical protein
MKWLAEDTFAAGRYTDYGSQAHNSNEKKVWLVYSVVRIAAKEPQDSDQYRHANQQ